MELSFNNLRCKDVVNVCDGKNLGPITDLMIDTCCGRIVGIIVPCNKSFFGLFKSNNNIFIPYNRICKIGKDIILVDIIMHNECSAECNTIIQSKDNTKLNNISSLEKINIQTFLNNEFKN